MPGPRMLERFCETLWEARQSPTDLTLVRLVKMQRLVTQTDRIYPDPETDVDAISSYDVPTHMAISSIRQEIDRLQPPETDRQRTYSSPRRNRSQGWKKD